MADNAQRDKNFVTTLLATSSVDGKSPVLVYADPTTHRILTEMAGISTFFQKDTFSSTNNQTTFIPSGTVSFDIYMSVNGSIQMPSTDYSIVGGSYVLNAGIPSGCAVILMYATS